MIREGDLTIYTRLRISHGGWLILRRGPRLWTASITLSPTATRIIAARSLRVLEQRLDQIDAPPLARTSPPE